MEVAIVLRQQKHNFIGVLVTYSELNVYKVCNLLSFGLCIEL